MSGGEQCSTAGSQGRKDVIAHIKSSLPPPHTQSFFITTSGQKSPLFSKYSNHWVL